MKTYDFSIAGLGIRLTAPWEFPVTERFAPFLEKELARVDLSVTLSAVPTLPEAPKEGLSKGFSFEARRGRARLCYHKTAPDGEPFALTEYGSGEVRLLVREGFEDHFSGLSALWNRIDMENVLTGHGRVLLHAALCERDGKGILFVGESGAGKSTQARLWQECRGWSVLNGDRAVLEKTDEGFVAHGSPWAGSSGIYQKKSARVALAAFPRKAAENRVLPLSDGEGFAALFPNIALGRTDAVATERAMELCESFVKRVPVVRLECRPDEGAVQALEEALK